MRSKTFLFGIIVLMLSSPLCSKNIDADHPFLQYFGRFDFSEPKKAQFDWPGVYIQAKFTGTSVALRFDARNERFNVSVDGKDYPTLLVDQAGEAVYPIAKNLSAGEHTLLIARRHENNWSIAAFLGLVIDENAQMLDLPPKPSLKMEFIGDSFVAGYGVESPTRDGGQDAYYKYTNTSKAFGPLVAAHYNAQYMISAYSGLGLVRNADGASPGKEFQHYYKYNLHSLRNQEKTPSEWNFRSWEPQVVVINLGINDFSGNQIPPADSTKWKAAYHGFLSDLRKNYPGTKFILCATPIWPHFLLEPLTRQVIDEEKSQNHNDVYYFGYTAKMTALQWHLSVEDDQNLARDLEALIDAQHILSK